MDFIENNLFDFLAMNKEIAIDIKWIVTVNFDTVISYFPEYGIFNNKGLKLIEYIREYYVQETEP